MKSKQYDVLMGQYREIYRTGHNTTDKLRRFDNMEIRFFKDNVKVLFERFDVETLLDYGCGDTDYELKRFSDSGIPGKMDISAREFFNLKEIRRFEPAADIDERQLSDAVVCFDVLEHIFITDIPDTIRELFSLAKKVLIVNVATYASRVHLPNGENAHITRRPPNWWKGLFDAISIEYPEVSVKLFCSEGYHRIVEYPLHSANSWVNYSELTVPMERPYFINK